ncbi:hypothetical protein ACEPPN_015053 [Leptodophora sp. 'Broadleaf-Isolate-01']
MKSNLIQHLYAKKLSLDLYLFDMKAILLHDYWNRLWIIQEVLLASEVFIQCGTESVTFTALHALINVAKSYLSMVDHPRDFKSPSLLSKIVDSPLALLIFRRNELERQPNQLFTLYPLLYLSADHATALCIDERDKIFGLCSLASFCCKNAVQLSLSMLIALGIDSLTPDIPEMRNHPCEETDWEDPNFKGSHVCDFLDEDCSCLTVTDVVSGRCPLPVRFPTAMDPRMTPDESSNAGG